MNDHLSLAAWMKRHQVGTGACWLTPDAAAELAAYPGFPPVRVPLDYRPEHDAEVILSPGGRVQGGAAVLAWCVATNEPVRVNLRVEH